ncbi:MAG: hypothetical protein KIT79_00975 [Deltaproteobacteria bacterium]|nr:hypothetical protein [Deltaproteobacteria bacterium]
MTDQQNIETITIEWTKGYEPKDLDYCAKQLKNSGGVYLWIFNGIVPRITYIGQAKRFLPRFTHHIATQLTGGYNAFDIRLHDDPLYFWEKFIINKEYDRNTTFLYQPRSPEDYQGCLKDRFFDERRRRMFEDYLYSHVFSFGLLKSADGKEDRIEKRKEVESILMHGVRRAYAQELKLSTEYDLKFKNSRSNASIIGGITQNPSGPLSLKHTGLGFGSLPEKIQEVLNGILVWPPIGPYRVS